MSPDHTECHVDSSAACQHSMSPIEHTTRSHNYSYTHTPSALMNVSTANYDPSIAHTSINER